ncbi:hypothetical protein NHX12_003218 [Muraenolepis orangiensis]|uniref:Reelin domain-containing protein n=1 Tax=Muraenolepis orangiensis TaxID=630683 RepID=A0A9Q0IG93_9TELE|nr:hypothetical protein NHX12_003218 [Muraenolepis orangiensis]
MVRGASLKGALGCTLLALILGSSSISSSSMDLGGPPAGFYPRFNPFFFLCTHHGELDGAGLAEGGVEVLLTFQVTGNPTAYTPGQEYQGLFGHVEVIHHNSRQVKAFHWLNNDVGDRRANK